MRIPNPLFWPQGVYSSTWFATVKGRAYLKRCERLANTLAYGMGDVPTLVNGVESYLAHSRRMLGKPVKVEVL